MNSYTLKSGASVQTIFPVRKEIEIGKLHVLLLMKPGGATPDNNVLCFDTQGNMIWKVEPYIPVKGDANPFMDLKKKSDTVLIGSTWKGIDVEIDINTGKVTGISKQRPW